MSHRTLLRVAVLLMLLLAPVALAGALHRVALPLVVGRPAASILGGCEVFPADNPWNQDISQLAVDSRSSAYIASISADGDQFLHADFGSNPSYGIPFVIVPAAQPLVPINFLAFADQSDAGPYPIPANAPVEGGSVRHVQVLRQSECKLYELYHAQYTGPGWNADSGAIWNLRSNALRPSGWTSADAAGLPILPGLARYDEAQSGEIRHALRFTVWRSQRGAILPATHQAGATDDPNDPPMGLRLRLKASYNISGFTGHARAMLEALRKYGMIVADNGTSWYISGATDTRWNDDDLDQLKGVPGNAFEVVQTGAVYVP